MNPHYVPLPFWQERFQYKYQGRGTEAVFIFHGYPAQKNKNHDLARLLNQKTHLHVHVCHYEGLGESSGNLNFYNSIKKSIKFVEFHIKQNKYKKINLIGHSWGGLISLNVALTHYHLVNRIILLSPFVYFPEFQQLHLVTKYFQTQYPHFFGDLSSYQMTQDLKKTKTQFDLIQKIKFFQKSSISWKVLILQAYQDKVTQKEHLLEFLSKKPLQNYSLKDFKTDHSFMDNRNQAIQSILKFFSQL